MTLRKEYPAKPIHLTDLDKTPLQLFEKWFQEACNGKIQEPNAMALATATQAGLPSNRMVIMKKFDETGFQFFTNYASRKGHEIGENPHVAALFWWREHYRQVILEGKVEKLSKEDSNALFQLRPKPSQISSWASKQGQSLSSREELEEAYTTFSKMFENRDVPLPEHCGGYRIIPHAYEFWQGQTHRLHDRFRYTLIDQKWQIERLSP